MKSMKKKTITATKIHSLVRNEALRKQKSIFILHCRALADAHCFVRLLKRYRKRQRFKKLVAGDPRPPG